MTITDIGTSADPNELAKQQLFARRLCQKIDYHKTYRMRVPSAVAVANFALVKLFDRQDVMTLGALAIGITIISLVGWKALGTIRSAFDENVDQYNYLYEQMGMKTTRYVLDPSSDMAEHAGPIWYWLRLLIGVSCFIPLSLIAIRAVRIYV